MISKTSLAAMSGIALMISGCGGHPPVSEAEAANFADETQSAWASRNVPAIESRYAKTVVGFDPMDPGMATTWEKWDSLQREFVRQGYDSVSVPERRIQILDGDTFVVHGIGSMKTLSKPGSEQRFRFTDVYQRQEEGRFLIVSEHVSMVPTSQK